MKKDLANAIILFLDNNKNIITTGQHGFEEIYVRFSLMYNVDKQDFAEEYVKWLDKQVFTFPLTKLQVEEVHQRIDFLYSPISDDLSFPYDIKYSPSLIRQYILISSPTFWFTDRHELTKVINDYLKELN